MSDLYTDIMTQLAPIIKNNVDLFFIFAGLFILVGAVFGIRWICDPQGSRPFGLDDIVHRCFGYTGYRILMGFTGVLFIGFGVLLWFNRR